MESKGQATMRHERTQTQDRRSTDDAGFVPGERPPRGRGRPSLAFVGGALGAASIALYATQGYSGPMGLLWGASLLLLSLYFVDAAQTPLTMHRRDVLTLVLLVAAFAPLYLAAVHSWPVQVNSDEVTIMTVAKKNVESGGDPFGLLADYLGIPAFIFLLFGKLGDLFGGVDLYHMRLVHGLSGIAVIAASYLLFRQLLPRGWAFCASVVVGANHALFMFSRMAMRENTAVLMEILALALLLYGLRRRHDVATFFGGLFAGFSFYVYFPSRATIVLWAVFLVLVLLWRPLRRSVPDLRRPAIVAATGFVIVAGPVLVAQAKAPPEVNQYQREQLLIFPEGRALAKDWYLADSEAEGVLTNIRHGLTAFNNTIVDHGWLYPNYGHGFLDPVSGVFLWIGVGVVGWRLIRRRGPPWQLLPLMSFLALWLAFSFIINKAPDYNRLLITLPFVAYLVIEGIRAVGRLVARTAARFGDGWQRRATVVVSVAALIAIVALNASSARDFFDAGKRNGDAIGSTGRYIEERDDADKTYFLATGELFPYYRDGFPHMFLDRMQIFAERAKIGGLVEPTQVRQFTATPPFAIFMRGTLWITAGDSLAARYPNGRLVPVTPDARRVVFEVPRSN